MADGVKIVLSQKDAEKLLPILKLLADEAPKMKGAEMRYARITGNDGVTRICKILCFVMAESPENTAAAAAPPAGYEEVERVFYDEDDCETSITDTILRKIVPP